MAPTKPHKQINHFHEPRPQEDVPDGDKVVKQPEDTIYRKKAARSTFTNPADYKEKSEQPVHPIKHPPKTENH